MTVKLAPNFDSGVIVVGEAGLRVDLSFVPPQSVFFSSWPEGSDLNSLERITIADGNSERTISRCRELISAGVSQITIVWNSEISRAYSFAMLALAREVEHCDFEILGSTAHLVVSNRAKKCSRRAITPEEMRSRLIEQLRRPSSVSIGELNFLMKDYAELLDVMEEQVRLESERGLELSALRKRSEQLPVLHEKLRELQSENIRLRKRNDALARKALNRLK